MFLITTEQTENIAQQKINCLFSKTKTECDYCAVRPVSVNIIVANFVFKV